MKMSFKLMIVFSLMAIVITVFFSLTSYQSNLNNLYNNTNTGLTSLSTKMQIEIEQYIRLMNFAIDELSSNIDFMDSFYKISTNNETDTSADITPAVTYMSQLMYQAPLQSEFYRITAFNDDGFVISNVFERTSSIIPFSDEAREVIESNKYLDILRESPTQPLILGVHADPWTAKSDNTEVVFSVLRAAVWHGQIIGYFEVLASLDDLAKIFLILEKEGISTQAIFDNGIELFRTYKDDFVYKDLPADIITTCKVPDSGDRWVIRRHSDLLGLNIYVSQSINTLVSNRLDILKTSFLTMLPVLLAALLLIIIISYSLTGSIRKLSKKIESLPADHFLSRSDLNEPTTVVSPNDREMYNLEQSFNTMLTKLRISHANELNLREGSVKAQLNALQMQINPHFVYNTLNIISSKGLENGNIEVTELCEQFAQMLRYSTDVRSQTATLQEELENTKRYLYLCKSRFEDTFEYEIAVPEELSEVIVPKLTLQPIVENAVKYGIKGVKNILKLKITGTVSDDELRLSIRDNGNGFDWDTINSILRSFRKIENHETPEVSEDANHVGLINTFRRLYYTSKGNLHMNIYNDNGAVVEIIQNISEVKKNV